MYEIADVPGGPFPTIALRDTAQDSTVELVPERGGLVTRFAVAGREVLYLDPATLADASKNVRGGIPILFPCAGRLKSDQYTAYGKTIAMKQHGFARNRPWRVLAREAGPERARVVLGLASDESTRALFPWDFELRFAFELAGRTLTIAQEYQNTSPEPMPLHAGFHPYFRVPDAQKARASVTTDATRAYDNTTGQTGPFTGIDLTAREVDLHLLDHKLQGSRLALGDGTAVRLETDDSFSTLVVWTLAGKDFVCVEPWTAPGDALNTQSGLILLPPGTTHEARVAISAE